MKLNENDSVPCLEVYVELENEHVRPESEFIYLHNVDVDFDEVLEEQKFKLEAVEWSPNIGKSSAKNVVNMLRRDDSKLTRKATIASDLIH